LLQPCICSCQWREPNQNGGQLQQIRPALWCVEGSFQFLLPTLCMRHRRESAWTLESVVDSLGPSHARPAAQPAPQFSAAQLAAAFTLPPGHHVLPEVICVFQAAACNASASCAHFAAVCMPVLTAQPQQQVASDTSPAWQRWFCHQQRCTVGSCAACYAARLAPPVLPCCRLLALCCLSHLAPELSCTRLALCCVAVLTSVMLLSDVLLCRKPKAPGCSPPAVLTSVMLLSDVLLCRKPKAPGCSPPDDTQQQCCRLPRTGRWQQFIPLGQG
jgi:hypothetical protein